MIKKEWLLTLILSFAAVSVSAQQTRTVTNEDLEKYRQKRVAAERDLRENYERLGFPSPAELEKQREQSRAEKIALAARLEAERIERERLQIERQRADTEARVLEYQAQAENNRRYDDNNRSYNNGLNGFFNFPGFGVSGYNRYNRWNRGGFGRNNRRGYGRQPRIEYRNNLPVIIPPSPRRILAPRPIGGGRRN